MRLGVAKGWGMQLSELRNFLEPLMDKTSNRFCIYTHTRPDTGTIFYVGIGLRKRPYTKFSRNKHWKNIVAKNNGEFIVDIIGDDLPWEFCCEVEKGLIKTYGRTDNRTGILCNLTDGGDGTHGWIASEQTKSRIGEKSVGRFFSSESRAKQSLAHKGRKQTPEARQNVKIGYYRTRGWVLDQVCVSTGKVLETFLGASQANRKLGVNISSVSMVLSNSRGLVQAGGFGWKKNYDILALDRLLNEEYPELDNYHLKSA